MFNKLIGYFRKNKKKLIQKAIGALAKGAFNFLRNKLQ